MRKEKMKIRNFLAASAAVASLAVVPAVNVFADSAGSTSENQDVTVGEVDYSVYDIDVSWGDMTFDWKYNETTEKYEFRPKVVCQANVDGAEAWQLLQENGNLYTDNQCTTLETGEISGSHYYQKAISGGKITVADNSTNGKVKATASFAPTTNYSWVSGHIGVQLMGNAWGTPIVPLGFSPATNTFSYTELENGELADESDPAGRKLGGYLYLTVNDAAAAQASSVASEDKIGTVTVEITPVFN